MQTTVIKNSLLTFLFLIGTGSAQAEWTAVMENDRATFYIDKTSIRKAGNLRKVWEIRDFKNVYQNAMKNRVMSQRQLQEYDCKNELFRELALSLHNEPMAQGGTTYQHTFEGIWEPIPPGTLSKLILTTVCSKRP